MRKVRLRLFLVLLILGLFPLASNAVVEEKSSIVGTLLSGPDNPMTGITVRLLDSFFLTECAKTLSDKQGHFKLENILPGLYLLSVEAPGKPGIFKRIQVVSGSPTFVDIRPYLTQEELKENSAWDRFKWTIRIGERNPLREQEDRLYAASTAPDGTIGILNFLRTFQQANNIEGELSYVSYSTDPAANASGAQVAEFGVQGNIQGRQGSWELKGNMLQGDGDGYMARGGFRYQMFGHRFGAQFSANDVIFAVRPEYRQPTAIHSWIPIAEQGLAGSESTRWVSSVDLNDSLKLIDRLQVAFGARIDYYGYLETPVSYSPRITLSYPVLPHLALRGRFYRNHSTPGNLYLQISNDAHPYVQRLAFISYNSSLQPESTTGYEAGFDYSNRTASLSAFYYRQNVANKMAALDLAGAGSDRQYGAVHPFVIFNSRNITSQGMEIDFRRQLNSMLTATASYTMEFGVPVYIIEKTVFSERNVYFRYGSGPDVFHDLRTGIKAHIRATLTDVQADWKWSSGSPLVYGLSAQDVPLTSIDIEVHQGLPIQVFSDTELKLLVAVRNLLDQNSSTTGNADFHRALLYGMPRLVAGGVLLEF